MNRKVNIILIFISLYFMLNFTSLSPTKKNTFIRFIVFLFKICVTMGYSLLKCVGKALVNHEIKISSIKLII